MAEYFGLTVVQQPTAITRYTKCRVNNTQRPASSIKHHAMNMVLFKPLPVPTTCRNFNKSAVYSGGVFRDESVGRWGNFVTGIMDSIELARFRRRVGAAKSYLVPLSPRPKPYSIIFERRRKWRMSPERSRWYSLRKMETIPELDESLAENDDFDEENLNSNCDDDGVDDAIVVEVTKAKRTSRMRRLLKQIVKCLRRTVSFSCLRRNR